MSRAGPHLTSATSITPLLPLARCAGLMKEVARDGSDLNRPMKGLNLSRTGALGDRQADHMLGLSALFSHEGQPPVWSAGPQLLARKPGIYPRCYVDILSSVNPWKLSSALLSLLCCWKYACFIAQGEFALWYTGGGGCCPCCKLSSSPSGRWWSKKKT